MAEETHRRRLGVLFTRRGRYRSVAHCFLDYGGMGKVLLGEKKKS
jgi:hypothetical protein